MNRIKFLLALVASVAAIAIGQRQQAEQGSEETRNEKPPAEGIDSDMSEMDAWFI